MRIRHAAAIDPLLAPLLLIVLLSLPVTGQPVELSLSLGAGGGRQCQFAGAATNYYVLYRGTTLPNLTNAVQVVLDSQPTTTMQDTNLQFDASFYRVLAVATNTPLDLDGDGFNDVAEVLNGRNPLVPESNNGGLVINEVDYDQVGTDGMEFAEILNTSAAPISLNGLRLILVNGATIPSAQYLSVDLSPAGSLAAGQYLVVKAATVSVSPGALTINFIAADNNIQNGAPDGLAIFDANTGTLLDAFSYEGSVTTAVFTGAPGTFNLVEGTALSASVADSNVGPGSLCRLPNGTDTNDANTDWALSNNPTPGTANVP